MKENEILGEELLDNEEIIGEELFDNEEILEAPVTHDIEEAVEGTLEEDKDVILYEISD